MASPSTVTMDLSQLEKALKEFSAFVVEESGEVVLDEARLLMVDGMNLTPPYGAGRRKGSTTAALKQGEAAVERSVLNSFQPLKTENVKSPWLRRLLQKDETKVTEYFRRNQIPPGKARVVGFDPRIHQGDRNPRTGRVYGNRGRYVVGSEIDMLQSYIRDVRLNVGIFKAAFATMAIELANHPRSRSSARVPAWVRRNLAKAAPLIRQKFISVSKTGATVIFETTAHNDLEYAYDAAIRRREQALVKKIKLIVEGRAKAVNTKFTIR